MTRLDIGLSLMALETVLLEEEQLCRLYDEEVEAEVAARKQCLGKGLEKALSNKGDIAESEQEMAHGSGTANGPQMKRVLKAVVGESSVA